MLNSDTESALRSAYARSTGGVDIPLAVTERLAAYDYHPRGNRPRQVALALAAAGVVAAGASAGAYALESGPGQTTIHLASYSLRLPAKYTPESSGSAACNPFGRKQVTFIPPVTQPAEPAMAAAADQDGGCVLITLGPAFTPSATASPLKVSVISGDGPFQGHTVEVDGYQAWVGSGAFTPTGTQQEVLVLFVPAPGGQVRDFTVTATGMSDAELVSVVSSGLSVPSQGSPTTTATTAPSATTTLPPEATTTSPVTTMAGA